MSNRKKYMIEIEEAIANYMEADKEHHGKPFKGQITVKINCINGFIANTSIYISKKCNKSGKITDFSKKSLIKESIVNNPKITNIRKKY